MKTFFSVTNESDLFKVHFGCSKSTQNRYCRLRGDNVRQATSQQSNLIICVNTIRASVSWLN